MMMFGAVTVLLFKSRYNYINFFILQNRDKIDNIVLMTKTLSYVCKVQYKKSKIWRTRLDILESIVKIRTLVTKNSRLIMLNFQL